MGNYTLQDILKNKKEGDEWYTLLAPEEARFWKLKKPWPESYFRNLGVSPVCLSVRSHVPEITDKKKYSSKEPLVLPCGVEFVGEETTKQSKKIHGKLRVDSGVELNIALTELSNATGYTQWEVYDIHIYNATEGVESQFKMHNPDGHGAQFVLFRTWKDKITKLYPEILLETQRRYVGGFQSHVSHCTQTETKQMIPSCGIEKKITKKQIVRRPRIQKQELGAI